MKLRSNLNPLGCKPQPWVHILGSSGEGWGAGPSQELAPGAAAPYAILSTHTCCSRVQDFYTSVLDVLTPDDVRVLAETEDELSRRGQFERVFPGPGASRYLRFFEQPRYFNILTAQWELRYHLCKGKGKSPPHPLETSRFLPQRPWLSGEGLAQHGP